MMSLRSLNYSKNEILALVFVFHSTFDVGRWMFDVHLFQSFRRKKYLSAYEGRQGHEKRVLTRLFGHGFLYFKQISVIILNENNQIISPGYTFDR